MAANPAIAARITQAAIIKRWPIDPMRPNVPFQSTLVRRLDRDYPQQPGKETAGESAEHELNLNANEGEEEGDEATAVPQVRRSTTAPEIQWAALKPLLDNSFTKAYPVSGKIMSPQSNPDYYRSLIHELDEAPKRGLLSNYLNSWKGFVRWQ